MVMTLPTVIVTKPFGRVYPEETDADSVRINLRRPGCNSKHNAGSSHSRRERERERDKLASVANE